MRRRRWLPRLRQGFSTDGSDPRPGSRLVHLFGRLRRRCRPGPGRSPPHPDARASQAAKVPAVRSGSTSIGRWVSIFRSTVAYTDPRRSAKSSTPSTRGTETGCSGNARTRRSNVVRDTATAILPANRAPARPASATATGPSIPSRAAVRRRRRPTKPSNCSANVRRTRPVFEQKNLRTARTIETGRPPTGRSASRR
jgi:hypothetical protein